MYLLSLLCATAILPQHSNVVLPLPLPSDFADNHTEAADNNQQQQPNIAAELGVKNSDLDTDWKTADNVFESSINRSGSVPEFWNQNQKVSTYTFAALIQKCILDVALQSKSIIICLVLMISAFLLVTQILLATLNTPDDEDQVGGLKELLIKIITRNSNSSGKTELAELEDIVRLVFTAINSLKIIEFCESIWIVRYIAIAAIMFCPALGCAKLWSIAHRRLEARAADVICKEVIDVLYAPQRNKFRRQHIKMFTGIGSAAGAGSLATISVRGLELLIVIAATLLSSTIVWQLLQLRASWQTLIFPKLNVIQGWLDAIVVPRSDTPTMNAIYQTLWVIPRVIIFSISVLISAIKTTIDQSAAKLLVVMNAPDIMYATTLTGNIESSLSVVITNNTSTNTIYYQRWGTLALQGTITVLVVSLLGMFIMPVLLRNEIAGIEESPFEQTKKNICQSYDALCVTNTLGRMYDILSKTAVRTEKTSYTKTKVCIVLYALACAVVAAHYFELITGMVMMSLVRIATVCVPVWAALITILMMITYLRNFMNFARKYASVFDVTMLQPNDLQQYDIVNPITCITFSDVVMGHRPEKCNIRIKQLSFNAGNSYAFTGANGAGKSTIARVLAGQFPKLISGHVILWFEDGTGIPINQARFSHLLKWVYCLDANEQLPENSTIRDFIHTYAPQTSDTEIFNALSKLGLWQRIVPSGLTDTATITGACNTVMVPSTFSGGEKNQLLLTALSCAKNKILVSDENSDSVEKGKQYKTVQYLTETAEANRCVLLFISHSNTVNEHPSVAPLHMTASGETKGGKPDTTCL
jgi:ABC-type multidrug transport system fused ATPase/permease subunit